MAAKADIASVFSKIRQLTKDAIAPNAIRPTGLEAANIIRRRTRLGYGVSREGGERFQLKPLSASYISFRQNSGYKSLSQYTTPTKSNLTFTGQMLDSLTLSRIENGKVVIAPTGTRTDKFSRGKTNAAIARYVAQGGRPFLYLTKPEVSQLVRFYRTIFGDLARRAGLT